MLNILKILTRLVIPVAILLWSAACSRQPRHEATYAYVRSIIDSVPERALEILESIPADRLQPGLDSARYILLHATAEDKLHNLTTSDSILQKAIVTFRTHSELNDLRYACYLKGSFLYEQGKYSQCIPYLMEAENLIDINTSEYEKGLIYHEISDYCHATMNGASALKYIRMAEEAYKRAHKASHLLYAKLNEAYILINSGAYNEAINLTLSIKDSAECRNDTEIMHYCIDILGRAEAGQGNSKMALSYLRQLENMPYPMSERTYGLLLHNEAVAGDNHRADSLARILLAQGNPWVVYALDPDSTSINVILDAYSLQNQETNDEIYHAYSNDYNVVLSENFRLKQNLSFRELEVRRLTIILLMSFIIIICIASIMIYKKLRKKINEEKATALALSQDFQSFMKFHKIELSSIQDKYIKSTGSLKIVLSRYIKSVNDFIDSTHQKSSILKTQRDLKKITEKSTELLRTDLEIQKELSNIIDLNSDNIISRLNTEIPNLDDNSRLIFILVASGFSTQACAQILQLNSRQYFNVCKSRLKRKLIKINPPSLEDFLRVL